MSDTSDPTPEQLLAQLFKITNPAQSENKPTPKEKKRRSYTPEQKQALDERLARMRAVALKKRQESAQLKKEGKVKAAKIDVVDLSEQLKNLKLELEQLKAEPAAKKPKLHEEKSELIHIPEPVIETVKPIDIPQPESINPAPLPLPSKPEPIPQQPEPVKFRRFWRS